MFASLDFVYVPTADVVAAAVDKLRAGGIDEICELEIPHGPCASFRTVGGQRYAVYQLVRPGADAHFVGRVDP